MNWKLFGNNEFYLSKSQLRELRIFKTNYVDRLFETPIEISMLVSLIEGYERYLLLHTQGLKFYKSKNILRVKTIDVNLILLQLY